MFSFAVAFAQVDWHDFVVVETVNFREDEIGKKSYFTPKFLNMRSLPTQGEFQILN